MNSTSPTLKRNDLRVGLYVRISTLDQNSELQHRELTDYASARGWRIRDVYEDKMSGTSDKRPQLQRLLTDAHERRIDVICCWKLDRFFRSLRDIVNVLEELNSLGVVFVSLRDHIDLTTAQGKLMVHMLAAFAEFEADLIRTRVRAGLENAKRNGITLGRPRLNREREIQDLRRQGHSYSEIERKLGVGKGTVCRALKGSTPKSTLLPPSKSADTAG